MRFLVDENCWGALVTALRAQGHDVLWAVDSMRGRADAAISQRSRDEQRAVVTQDRGFAQHLTTGPDQAFAVVLLRLHRLPPGLRIQTALDAIAKLQPLTQGQVAIIGPALTRIRAG